MVTRKAIGRGFLIYLSMVAGWYYMKYNRAHWEKHRGAKIYIQKETVYPGDVRFPRADPRTESWQHYDRDFHNRKVFLNKD